MSTRRLQRNPKPAVVAEMATNGVRDRLSSSFAFSVRDLAITPMQREDIPEVRKIHDQAFAGYMNTRLGATYTDAFLNWFLTADGAAALVARDAQGTIVGYVLGAPNDYGKSMNQDLFRVAAISVIARPWLFFSRRFWTIIAGRIRSTLKFSNTPKTRLHLPQPAMWLVAIGVAPSARGKSVGLHIMRAFEDKARALRMRSLQLTVYSNNAIARKLYETCRWSCLRDEAVEDNGIVRYFRVLS